ncbi:MAG: hypothetical protein KAW56_07050 [Candidatus Marinimicrobia bacterium]|nr:hypothetical protein [Candidatus Neomarinimicrobiota bacterium]
MSKIDGGATLWARQTIDSKIFCDKPHVWFKIWFYLITKANHKDNKQFKRGSCFMKYEWIMQKTRAKKSELDHAMRWFRFGKMVATQKATRGFTLKVLNYNGYQSLENYKSDTKSDSKSEMKAKQKRNESDTINKNVKNDKNVIKKEKGIFFKKAWQDFKEMRRKIKKPMTEKAEEMLLNNLNKLSKDKKEQVAILNQSVFHCWQGVYQLKDRPQDSENQPKYISKKEPPMTPEQIARNKAKITEVANAFKGKFNI